MPSLHLLLQLLPERILAYRRTPMYKLSVDDLRQMLRDLRGLVAAVKEGSPHHESASRHAAHIEAEIRGRIAADLAALKLADD